MAAGLRVKYITENGGHGCRRLYVRDGMEASLIAIGTKADTTNARSIPINHRGTDKRGRSGRISIRSIVRRSAKMAEDCIVTAIRDAIPSVRIQPCGLGVWAWTLDG